MIKKILHPVLKLWIKLTCYFYFERIEIKGKENLPENYPVIFACNHPNSFLDSLILTITVGRSIHYTARGDIFKPGIISRLLGFMNILPVFRREEGKENLHKNSETFSTCLGLFKKDGAVVIYSEGICENDWDLRPLRKGTARLAIEAWNNPEIGDKLKVVPVSIQYSSWLRICPKVYIEFLENIENKSVVNNDEKVNSNKIFNEQLRSLLARKCIVADKSNDLSEQNKVIGFVLKNLPNGEVKAKQLQDKFNSEGNEVFKAKYKAFSDYLTTEKINYYREKETGLFTFILSLKAFTIASLLNFIPGRLCKQITWRSTKGNVYYDSILFALLLFIYPIYLASLFCVTNHYLYSWVAIFIVIVTVLSAGGYEWAKRNMQCFLKKDKLKKATEMLNSLFETDND